MQPPPSAVRETVTDRLEDTLDLLQSLVGYPTVSADSNLEMVADLASRLGDYGARVDLFSDESGTKANLFATLGPEGDGGLVLSGHTDVAALTNFGSSNNSFTIGDSLSNAAGPT